MEQFYIDMRDLNFIPPSINKWIQLIGDISEKGKEKSFKVKIKMADKKLSELTYNIITNTLQCEYIVSKWDKSVSDNCVLCEEKYDLVHLLFTCVFTKEALKLVSNFLKLDIKLSDIVFDNKLSCLENYITSFVTFCIFKFWIPGNKNQITIDIHNFKIFVKHELLYKS